MDYIRYTCAAEGYEHNWAEIATKWTRRELRDYAAQGQTDEQALSTLNAKLGECYIEIEGREPLTHGSDLDEEIWLDLDLVLAGFLVQLPYKVAAKLSTLGNLSGRVSSELNGQPLEMIAAQSPTIPEDTP